MDLHYIGAESSGEERSAVDAVVGPPDEESATRSGLHDALSKRHLLLPALNAVQGQVGWISPGALDYISRRLTVPPAEAYGVATFYALLSTESRPRRVAHVCDDIACQLAGAETLCRELETAVGPEGESWHRSPCLGQCERAPAALLQLAGNEDWTLTSATAASIAESLAAKRHETPLPSAAPQTRAPRAPGGEALRILRRIGRASPTSLDDYREQGGYRALRRALELGPEAVLREVKESGVRGRGGAAFPMGVKWEAVAKAPVRPHYVVCNADESEPGTFKDRLLMEEDPFAVIEAITIAGYAVGSPQGYIYVRGEYPLAIRRLQHAIETAEKRGFLGENVMGEGFDFRIEVRKGAGAYICGEETALFNSIEGYRGEPRSKPPFPVQVGLFKKPTVVNNVETLVNVLDIVLDGGPAFAAIGTKESAGPKLFCVSGHVARPGVYEVPFGATLREVIELAGGVPGGKKIKTILLGGAAGSFVGPEDIDTSLTFEGTRTIGATLGSGVIMVFDEASDMRAAVARIARFFRDESCGQCVPCRVGTVRQEEALSRLARNGDGARESALLDQLA
ncbi:MAG TPA: NAD(P)H-dependent oxidoreductase subunit E, partial [Vicinamibacteria bacterium]|nr:NAD(P)H-dependent oxidoreductase subunit E [Vicinamibacteria bacterium]